MIEYINLLLTEKEVMWYTYFSKYPKGQQNKKTAEETNLSTGL